jgi:threonine/homoserine/homoserine lactone efflux protein
VTGASVLTYALALGLAAAIPGPGVVALVARALASGFRGGMSFAVGLILGDLTYLAAAVFGLTRIAEALGDVFVVVRIGAALYLGYLAIQLWRASARPPDAADRGGDHPLAGFVAGLSVTLANPKTIVFYLAVLPTLMDLRGLTRGDLAVLVAVTALVLVAVMTPYAALAARARGTLQRSAFRRRLNRSAAAIMAGAAIWTVARRV